MASLEKNLEARCRRLALEHDGELLKMRPAQKGWHDRLLLLPGYMALIEFKRDAKAAVQPLQDERQKWCEKRAVPAYRIWDYETFRQLVARKARKAGEVAWYAITTA